MKLKQLWLHQKTSTKNAVWKLVLKPFCVCKEFSATVTGKWNLLKQATYIRYVTDNFTLNCVCDMIII